MEINDRISDAAELFYDAEGVNVPLENFKADADYQPVVEDELIGAQEEDE
jgi:hypothetical protein